MDDLTDSPPVPWTLSRSCETSRFQGQLLARAYQQIFPEVRRPLVDRAVTLPENPAPNVSTAVRVAAGA